MKTIKGLIAIAALICLSTLDGVAIQGLQLSVQCSNVVLTWPSVDGSGDTYLIRRRPDLSTNSSWTVVTDFYPAATGTNLTTFIDYGVVTNAVCDGGGGSPDDALAGSRGSLRAGGVSGLNGADSGIPPLPPLPPGFDYAPDGSVQFVGMSNLRGASGQSFGNGFGSPRPDDAGGSSTNAGEVSAAFYEVVKDGVTLYGLTNGMSISDVLQLSVEVANPSGQLINLVLEDSGSPIASSIHGAPFESPVPLLGFDTTQMSNGVHSIVAHAMLFDPGDGGLEDGTASVYDLYSPAYSVTISNEISFPNWMGEFGELGDTLAIYAQSAHTNAQWYIDVYDSLYNYIGTFSDVTPDGNINVVWNLVGPDGTVYNDPTFEFVITTVYGDPTTTSQLVPPTYRTTDPWNGPGDWVVVNQQAWNNLSDYETLDTMTDGFVSLAQNAGLTVHPTPSSGGNAYRLSFGTTDTGDAAQSATDWENFRAALYDNRSRNLFYLGHGDANGLGYDASDTNRYISAQEIGYVQNTIPLGQTNKYKFRFVCLDGCNTANGLLPEAFGIIHKENVPDSYYYENSIRPSAFVGWNNASAAGFIDVINVSHVNFFQHFQYQLAMGNGVKQSLETAANYPDVIYFYINNLKVFGDWSLNYYSFNR